MCRHLARVGDPLSLQALLLDPPCSLLRQSWEPRRQRNGKLNADGFGVGWFSTDRPEPARYRRSVPLWTDASFASLAGVVSSSCVLAAVRSATAGMPQDEAACAPFLLPRGVLLSHNGRVPREVLAPLVSSAALAAIGSTVDSAFLAALVAARLDAGEPLVAAVASVVRQVAEQVPDARLNLLATDGTVIVATAYGDTLCWRATADAVVVASEPYDDEPGWNDVPDRSVVVASDGQVEMNPLEETA
jgi:glutamine amidotransferase